MFLVLIGLRGNLSGQLFCLWVLFSSEIVDSSSEPQRKIDFFCMDFKTLNNLACEPLLLPFTLFPVLTELSAFPQICYRVSVWNGTWLSCLANSDDSQSSAPVSPQVKASCILSFLLSPGQITSSPSAFLYFLYSNHKGGIYHTIIIGSLLFC